MDQYTRRLVEKHCDLRMISAALVGECESIISSGALTNPAEQSLRLLVAEALSVLELQPKEIAA